MLRVFLPESNQLALFHRPQYTDKSLQIPQLLSGNYVTLGWVCVFVSCICVSSEREREGSPPWQGLEPHRPRPLCLAVNGAFFTKPTERQSWFTTNDHKWKEQPCLECAPSSSSLRSPLYGGLRVNVTQGIKVNKTPNISLDVFFFCILYVWSNVRPQWRDRRIFWPTDNTNTVVKQRGWFISSGPWNAPWRETKMVLLTGFPVNDISRRNLDDWMCVCAKATDEF